jgi:uncharacterized protein YjbI with pentapeptide repeats
MANPEHVAKLLKEGVEAWNQWREAPPVSTSLAEAALTRADLSGADLSYTYLRHADLAGADLRAAVLREAELSGARLSRADLTAADLTEGIFDGADLSLALFRGANLSDANLSMANLYGADLTDTDIRGAELSGADLSYADLEFTDLRWANLTDANLKGANLTGANLTWTALSNSNLEGVTVGLTIFGVNNLSTTKGLETMQHEAPSTIGIDTIHLSKGVIPEVFLRGAGVPEDFITYMKSLTLNPVDFKSCFISYSTKDESFAKELHSRLQVSGVRCWFAPENLKIGDRFQERIEESIRLYDKLLVVLSESSVNSAWVEREVQAAFEKEQRQGSTVLFPVRLDEAVMDSSRAWAAEIRRTRHIGDFRNWKDHDSFQKSLDRLLRDLKSLEPGSP